MSDKVIMDLHADFASACAKELRAAGYTPAIGPAADIIRSYANVRHRRVAPRPRKVHRANYTVPTQLIEGEQAFVELVTLGGGLRPYQSTKLANADFDDAMLNDFGIHHFHLGIGPHPTKPGFKERKELLLFALLRDHDFYCLGYYAHGAWSQKDLLDLIHTTWPHLIASNSLIGSNSPPNTNILAPQRNFTDAEVNMLRKNGINELTRRPDGTIHCSPGGGVTTNGKSAKVVLDVVAIRRLCNEIEDDLKSELELMFESGELVPPLKLCLKQQGSNTFAVVDGSRVKFNLCGNLVVPPL